MCTKGGSIVACYWGFLIDLVKLRSGEIFEWHVDRRTGWMIDRLTEQPTDWPTGRRTG